MIDVPSHTASARETLQSTNNEATRITQGPPGFDQSALLSSFKCIKDSLHSLTRSYNAKVDGMMTDIKTLKESDKNIREDINELNIIMSTAAVALFSKIVPTEPRKREIRRRLCLLSALFNDKLMVHVLC